MQSFSFKTFPSVPAKSANNIWLHANITESPYFTLAPFASTGVSMQQVLVAVSWQFLKQKMAQIQDLLELGVKQVIIGGL